MTHFLATLLLFLTFFYLFLFFFFGEDKIGAGDTLKTTCKRRRLSEPSTSLAQKHLHPHIGTFSYSLLHPYHEYSCLNSPSHTHPLYYHCEIPFFPYQYQLTSYSLDEKTSSFLFHLRLYCYLTAIIFSFRLRFLYYYLIIFFCRFEATTKRAGFHVMLCSLIAFADGKGLGNSGQGIPGNTWTGNMGTGTSG